MPYDRVPMANVEDPKLVPFDREHPRYRCCCQKMHVTTGLKILAVLLVVSAVLHALHTIGVLMTTSYPPAGLIFVSLIKLAIYVLIPVTVIEAISKEKPAYLIPYLITQGIGIAVVGVCLLILVGIAIFVKADTVIQYIESQTRHMYRGSEQALKAFVLLLVFVILTVMLAIAGWLFWVVIKAYRFYRDQNEYKRRTTSYHYNAPAMEMA